MNAVARRYAPVLTLLMLSPLIGEVLFGAVPLSALPFGLFGLVSLYGGGALLVREIVRGRELSTAWIVLLGLAYGIFEEGPVVQSLFDQHSPRARLPRVLRSLDRGELGVGPLHRAVSRGVQHHDPNSAHRV